MDLLEIAQTIAQRVEVLGWTPAELAGKAGCTQEQAEHVLAGRGSASTESLQAVCSAIGYVLLALPAPATKGLAGGFVTTAPTVRTKVQAALDSLRPLEPLHVALMLDLDGVVHAAGDSRMNDNGQLVGERMFRWWSQLEQVLNEHPDLQVVVHSSWRKFWPRMELLRPLLPQGLADRVVGVTDPDILDRQESIERWVEDHPGVGAVVILDDDPSAFDVDHPDLVVCQPDTGLSDPAVVEKLRLAVARAKAKLAQL
jgi:transcriptional regulator with XRE-family HTH domain